MALSLLHKYYASSSSSSSAICSLFIKSRFLATKAFLFSANFSGRKGTPLLEVKDLRAVISSSNKEILEGVNLTIHRGQVHQFVGDDGSGKSTLMKVLIGDPDYRVTGGSVLFKGINLLDLDPHERSSTGGFISFKATVEEHVMSCFGYPRKAYCNALKKHLGIQHFGPVEDHGKKHNEVRQLAVLGGELGILDEIELGSGDETTPGDEMLAVITEMNKLLAPKYSHLMITHFRRLLEFVAANDYVHSMENGILKMLPPRQTCYEERLNPSTGKLEITEIEQDI